jgi:hypothetical protein
MRPVGRNPLPFGLIALLVGAIVIAVVDMLMRHANHAP